MYTLELKHRLIGISFVLLALVAGLWSWNTLADLFGLPSAGFKHVLAAGILMWCLRWLLIPNRHSRLLPHGHRHE